MELESDDVVWVRARVHLANDYEQVALIEITGFKNTEDGYFSAVFPYDCLLRDEDIYTYE